MPDSLLILLLALFFDFIVGDPRWLLHPTQIMGTGISWLEKCFYRTNSFSYQLLSGAFIVIIIVVASWLITWGLLRIVEGLYWLKIILAGWLLSTTIAPRGLALAGLSIYKTLAAGDLATARRLTGSIVGRDTDSLNEQEVIRATVETVAENTADGVIAPLLYFYLGGVPLAMVYRAINTLDSMLGYKNERYLYFGRAAARLDDLANLLPGRLSGLALCIAAIPLGKGLQAWSIMWRDAGKHPSPNSGYPEAAVAGALGVQLGGVNYYQGKPSQRALLGEAVVRLQRQHILQAVYLMIMATLIVATVGGFGILWLL